MLANKLRIVGFSNLCNGIPAARNAFVTSKVKFEAEDRNFCVIGDDVDRRLSLKECFELFRWLCT